MPNKSQFPKKVFGRSIIVGTNIINNPEKGKRVYYGEDKLSYMDKSVDLSQYDYKRFNLSKCANNVMNMLGKRTNSIEPCK
jgi:hypothetical protein